MLRAHCVVLLTIASGCRADEAPGEAEPIVVAALPGASVRDSTAPGCSPGAPGARGTWGIAAYDALYGLTAESGVPWVYAPSPLSEEVATGGEALARLEAAAVVDPAVMSDATRVVLQNDAWGLAHRLERDGVSSTAALALRTTAWRWVRALALPASRLRALDGRPVSPWVRAHLPAAEGWSEVASEMPVLSHENLFGLRRIFRLARRGDEIALFSQMVALDDVGVAHSTSVAGEIEALTMGPEAAVSARVWELDRRALRCGAAVPLVSVDVVAHVPARGADGHLAVFDPPAPIADLPCLQCHHDADLQSLPTSSLEPSWRWPSLLEQAAADLPP